MFKFVAKRGVRDDDTDANNDDTDTNDTEWTKHDVKYKALRLINQMGQKPNFGKSSMET